MKRSAVHRLQPVNGRSQQLYSAPHQKKVTKTLTPNIRGFTIIEVLIVLAIAGLILLIVFEAIPALTRESRNNQRKQDVTAILSAVSHYELNNGGNFPTACGQTSSNPCSSLLQYTTLTFYELSSNSTAVQVFNQSATSAVSQGPESSTDTVYLYNYENCNPSQLGASTTTGAGYSNIVALYALETGSGVSVPQCQQIE